MQPRLFVKILARITQVLPETRAPRRPGRIGEVIQRSSPQFTERIVLLRPRNFALLIRYFQRCPVDICVIPEVIVCGASRDNAGQRSVAVMGFVAVGLGFTTFRIPLLQQPQAVPDKISLFITRQSINPDFHHFTNTPSQGVIVITGRYVADNRHRQAVIAIIMVMLCFTHLTRPADHVAMRVMFIAPSTPAVQAVALRLHCFAQPRLFLLTFQYRLGLLQQIIRPVIPQHIIIRAAPMRHFFQATLRVIEIFDHAPVMIFHHL
ncbi:hypothetical protein Ppb6_01902 [Photorhabdus australis subsp. thailandensis]|uniref:Uncharacterized protein n=1 Tax=Photorhabdus australis subsp. thailandensis TaxID=2805096 RepID=A0A1C0U4P5_9GAMM|nr:hypothetical protein Ppb6_01902 [Photorhabdus australis subsp. thailandensis]